MNSLSKQTLESLCKSVKGIQPRSSTLESNSDYAVPVTVAIIESWVKDDQEAMTCDIRERTCELLLNFVEPWVSPLFVVFMIMYHERAVVSACPRCVGAIKTG